MVGSRRWAAICRGRCASQCSWPVNHTGSRCRMTSLRIASGCSGIFTSRRRTRRYVCVTTVVRLSSQARERPRAIRRRSRASSAIIRMRSRWTWSLAVPLKAVCFCTSTNGCTWACRTTACA
jgi:hypothetical protein